MSTARGARHTRRARVAREVCEAGGVLPALARARAARGNLSARAGHSAALILSTRPAEA